MPLLNAEDHPKDTRCICQKGQYASKDELTIVEWNTKKTLVKAKHLLAVGPSWYAPEELGEVIDVLSSPIPKIGLKEGYYWVANGSGQKYIAVRESNQWYINAKWYPDEEIEVIKGPLVEPGACGPNGPDLASMAEDLATLVERCRASGLVIRWGAQDGVKYFDMLLKECDYIELRAAHGASARAEL